jgi:hypothetical protein
MAAIITNQFRILNASNFVSDVESEQNSYYTFVGLPNPTDYNVNWEFNPPSPKDSFEQEDDCWDTIIALKRVYADDVRQVVKKNTWTSGTTYDMYRHDISRTNTSKPSQATNLYEANYYVINEDYKVYICLYNGTDPENPTGKPSLDQPLFTDLEPRIAGDRGDGYIWKYLFTIKPSEIVKFDSTNFIPVPKNWKTNTENASIRNNAETSGQIKIITIKNRGTGIGTANSVYSNVPIKGDGTGARATIVIDGDSKVASITVSNGGSGYTYGTVDLDSGGVPDATASPTFDVIIPPVGGHGADIYRELGAKSVLFYSRIENNFQDTVFTTGNQIARVGIVRNPKNINSDVNLTIDKASGVYALKLTGIGYSSAIFLPDSFITQTVGLGSTAVGRVVSYDKVTGVLRYWQDKSLVGFNTDGSKSSYAKYGFNLNKFTSSPTSGGSLIVDGENNSLGIDTTFSGISTVINSKTYYLGQTFTNGVSSPNVQKYTGDIIYIDNRPSITRSVNQKEDVKIILQF